MRTGAENFKYNTSAAIWFRQPIRYAQPLVENPVLTANDSGFGVHCSPRECGRPGVFFRQSPAVAAVAPG